MKSGNEKKIIVFIIVAALSVILVKAESYLLRKSMFKTAPIATYQLVAATLLALIISFLSRKNIRKFKYFAYLVISTCVAALFVLFDQSLLGPMIAVIAVSPSGAMLGNYIISKLPTSS